MIADGKESGETLTTDTTHPTDRGHAVYAGEVEHFLEQRLEDTGEPPSLHALPAPLSRYPLEHARTLDAKTVAGAEWKEEQDRSWGKTRRVLACDRPGSEVRFGFHGAVVGASWVVGPDSGQIECIVDGRPPVTVPAFDKYCVSFRRLFYFLLTGYPEGEHTVVLRILPTRDARSQGTWIRFHTFLAG